jgi:iron complex transport system substrate-binding protein
MKNIKSLFLLTAVCLLSSCQKPASTMASAAKSTSASLSPSATAEETDDVTITDLIGRTVTVNRKKADRICCIGAGSLRLYTYVGELSKLVGVEEIEQNDTVFTAVVRPYMAINNTFFKTLPSCGKGGPMNQAPEAEKILSCKPNLVISLYTSDSSAMDTLQTQLGCPVVTLSYGTKEALDDKISTSLTLLGTLLHQETRAQELTDYIAGMRQDIDDRTKDIAESDKKSVYIGGLGNWGTKDIYSTNSSYSLFQAGHIKNVLSESQYAGVTRLIDKEAFTKLDADIIIMDAAGMAKFKSEYQAEPETFNAIAAFKNNQVYLQMPYNAYYTNIEVAYMDLYFDAKTAFPTPFDDVDIVSKSNEITAKFLGVSYYSEIAAKSYGGFQKIDFATVFNS